jgi:U3 small nucleolar RNA-associated protein 4
VWSLAALADGTVVSGDSLGHVPDSGTAMVEHSGVCDQNDKAAMLDLDRPATGNKVFASGVDSRVVCIERSNVESSAESRKCRNYCAASSRMT